MIFISQNKLIVAFVFLGIFLVSGCYSNSEEIWVTLELNPEYEEDEITFEQNRIKEFEKERATNKIEVAKFCNLDTLMKNSLNAAIEKKWLDQSAFESEQHFNFSIRENYIYVFFGREYNPTILGGGFIATFKKHTCLLKRVQKGQ